MNNIGEHPSDTHNLRMYPSTISSPIRRPVYPEDAYNRVQPTALSALENIDNNHSQLVPSFVYAGNLDTDEIHTQNDSGTPTGTQGRTTANGAGDMLLPYSEQFGMYPDQYTLPSYDHLPQNGPYYPNEILHNARFDSLYPPLGSLYPQPSSSYSPQLPTNFASENRPK